MRVNRPERDYDEGYSDGLERRASELQAIIAERDGYKTLYEYILKLKTEELLAQPIQPFILLTGRPITPADIESLFANPNPVQIAAIVNRITRGAE